MRDSQEDQISEVVSNSLDLTSGPDATQIDDTRKSTESRGLRMEGDLILNRYLLIERLGKGTQGEVWKVFDQQVKMQSALKFLPPDFQHSPAKHAELTHHRAVNYRAVNSCAPPVLSVDWDSFPQTL
jgi:serine/threonine protein kinase